MSEDEFTRLPSGKFHSWCNGCRRISWREQRAKALADPESAERFREAERLRKRRWRARNEERVRAINREYARRKRTQDRETVNAYQRKWRAENRERAREHQLKYWREMMADPDKHARYLENRRIAYALKKEAEGKTVRKISAQYPARDMQHRVPTAPIRRFLEDVQGTYDISHGDIGRATGVHPDMIRNILKGKYARTQLKTVDAILTTYGGPPIVTLYPDL